MSPASPTTLDRRTLLRLAGLGALQLAALTSRPARAGQPASAVATAADGLLEVPHGFSAVVVQRAGVDRLDDGRPVPGCLDGMACFEAGPGRWVLLRNHEIGDDPWIARHGTLGGARVVPWTAADRPVNPTMRGGVSAVTLDAGRLMAALGGASGPSPVLGTAMRLTGTDCNCSGGVVAGGWVSCEESDVDGHGYAYHVPAEAGQPVTRLDAWGRFAREGVARGADGTLYMTEDDRAACFYRFRPDRPESPLGSGVLEVLSVPGLATTGQLAASHPLALGEGVPVRWLPVPDPAARTVRCRAQVADATRFQRTEGIVWDGRSVVMAATEGGLLGRGQLWRLTPGAGGAPDSLSLVLEVRDPRQLSLPDNLAVAPWGDVIVCEDNYDAVAGVTHQNLRRVTPDGRVLALARNLDNAPIGRRGAPGGEFAGACFSPDGRVLFVNLQERDVTLAITGPWPARAT